MLKRRTNTFAVAALIPVTLLLVLLAWRGLRVNTGKDMPATLSWREAGEADLFQAA